MTFTFFFRDRQTLELAIKYSFEYLKNKERIEIWDAGCSQGAESFSLAILMHRHLGPEVFERVRIIATDLDRNGKFSKIIEEGIYPLASVKRIPKETRDEYFHPTDEEGSHYQINDEIHQAVSFHKHDILSLKPIKENLSGVLCKNVMIHFTPQQQIDAFKLYHRSLAEGGFLVTDNSQPMPEECAHLFQRIVNNVRIYRKVEVATEA